MTKSDYEYIVLGCGGIGCAVAFWLSRRAGSEVLGLEQFELGHARGGSQDFSRIIRLTYHADEYTRLTPHTYMAWAVIEDESALKIVHKTGGLTMALKEDRRYQPLIEDYARSMAGQATFIEDRPVTEIRPFEGGIELETPKGRFTCRRLIVAAGGWTDKLLAKINLTLRITVTEEQVTYYATPNLKDFAVGRFPVFIWKGDDLVYGFPVYGEVATKVGLDASGPEVDPDRRDYRPDPLRERRAENWLKKYIPGFLGPILYTKTCQYAMPRDRGFVVDRLPGYPQISLVVGAGHAYKFAALIGKTLSKLAIDGGTSYPIDAFAIGRPAITDPDFRPSFQT